MDWRRMFEGRDADLKLLIECWNRAKQGQPQVAVILGETGLGKTRLMHAFYQWLSRNEDAAGDDGYWPDIFTDELDSELVNPRFTLSSDTLRPIPYLWWGIRFSPPDLRNPIGSRCGLEEYARELRLHLPGIDLAQRQMQAIRRAAGDAAADTAWDLLQIAGEALMQAAALPVFLGLKLGKRGYDLWRKNTQAAEEARRSPGEIEQHIQQTLEGEAAAALAGILSPESKKKRRIPVILLLDDAQWADPVTLSFVEKLLRLAAQSNGPLLLLVTHWEKEWHQAKAQAAAPPMHGSAEAALAERPRSFADACERLLRTKALPAMTLRTLAAIPDLGAVADAALPGLTPAQRELLLQRAGGNPLLLRELIEYLKPDFFQGRSKQAALTPVGEDKLRRVSTDRRNYIDERFNELPERVRHVLGWSSYQGDRFLREVTRRAPAPPRLGRGRCQRGLQRSRASACAGRARRGQSEPLSAGGLLRSGPRSARARAG